MFTRPSKGLRVEIVGTGFLAKNLAGSLSQRHPEVVALAAGVSSTSVTAAADLDREAELVYRTLRRCRADGRSLLFFSTASFAMYGSSDVPAVEDGPLYPPAVYGRHKLALEACIRQARVEFLILRLSHLVGPHQRRHQLLPALVHQVTSGTVTIYRGAQRDLLDTADLVRAIDGLLVAGVRGEVINVVSGAPCPVDVIVDGIERRLDVKAHRTMVDGHASRTLVSTQRLRSYVPDAVPVAGDGYVDRLLDDYLTGYAPIELASAGDLG